MQIWIETDIHFLHIHLINTACIKSSRSVECALRFYRVRGDRALRAVASTVFLMALWLLMSGVYKPLVIGFGVGSVLLIMVILWRMDRVDGDHVQIRLNPLRFLGYIIWLFGEIAKSNWAVTRVILTPVMPIRQKMLVVPQSQKTDLAQVIFANSITLTPGTISVETEENGLLVHALSYGPEDDASLADMDRRVTAVETEGQI